VANVENTHYLRGPAAGAHPFPAMVRFFPDALGSAAREPILAETGRHAATITLGRPGMLLGAMTYLMQDEDGQTIESNSISAGLDYPGVGPEHSYLSDIGRVTYEPVTDTEAMDALSLLCRTEGIIPAIESSHALAGALRVCQRWAAEDPEAAREKTMIVCLSGRGDKDMETAQKWFGLGKAIPSSTLMTGNKEAAASAEKNAQTESEAK
ncbi:MAG: tryptophan synthase subunit beta, partial [Rothia mucilaginosa]|nr:tryptophan synthase subunit beta [Rothia mucilaginosa]